MQGGLIMSTETLDRGYAIVNHVLMCAGSAVFGYFGNKIRKLPYDDGFMTPQMMGIGPMGLSAVAITQPHKMKAA